MNSFKKVLFATVITVAFLTAGSSFAGDPIRKFGRGICGVGFGVLEIPIAMSDIQKEEGGLIGQILVSKNFVTEEDVVIALAHQLNYPYLPVSSFVINQDAVRAVSADLALEYVCIPVDKVSGHLAVVMSDPSNAVAVRTLEKVSGCRVQAFVGTISEIEDAIERCYKKKFAKAQGALADKMKMVLRKASQERQKQQK
jgi:hypothetical protein